MAPDLEGYERAYRLRSSADDDLLQQVFGKNELSELAKTNPTLLETARSYFPHLTASTYERLSREPEQLKVEKDRCGHEMEQLAVQNYGVFIGSAKVAENVRKELADAQVHLSSVAETLAPVQASIEEFQAAAATLAVRRTSLRNVLQQHSTLFELLELPSILDACVRNQMYDESLELLAHCNTLLASSGGDEDEIAVLAGLREQVAVQRGNLHSSLVAQLKMDIHIPQCVRVIGFLRRIQRHSEEELRSIFIEHRGSFLEGHKQQMELLRGSAGGRGNVVQALKNAADLLRTHVYDIGTQYKALFPQDDGPLVTWLGEQIMWLVSLLRAHVLPSANGESSAPQRPVQRRGGDAAVAAAAVSMGTRIDAANLTMILKQCWHASSTLKRLGGHFFPAVLGIFELRMERHVCDMLDIALMTFHAELGRYDWVPSTALAAGGGTGGVGANSAASSPSGWLHPQAIDLTRHRPLAVFTNEIFQVFIELRQCILYGIRAPVVTRFEECLLGAIGQLKTARKSQALKAGSATKSTEFTRLCRHFIHILVPLVDAHLEAVFGASARIEGSTFVAQMVPDLLPASEVEAECLPPEGDDAAAVAAAPTEAADGEATIAAELLAKQDTTTTAAIIEAFQSDQSFIEYSKRMTESIVNRDNEDGVKLQKGIDMAVDKGVLAARVDVEPITRVQVEGKSVDAVGGEIIKALGEAPSRGCVMTLQGGSGTGKGETVKYMKKALPNAQTWSNGNVFRSLTLLAVTYAEQNGCSLQDALQPDVLASFVGMLEFGEFNGKFDVKIEGLGLRYFVSDIQTTELAVERVAKNIPTVAEVTQGEVINFVQGAFAKLCGAGMNVLVEGREQTLNYIRTPHRFELVLDNPNIIGMRRAAQLMAGSAHAQLKDQPAADGAAVRASLESALRKLAEAGGSPAATPSPPKASITLELLARQDTTTTAAIIDAFQGSPAFIEYSKRTTASIVNRDNEDGVKLQKGIDMAVAKGVLDAKVDVEPITKVQVEGKTVDAVGGEIIKALGEAPNRGCVMTLQGGSGTGKGETVKYMKGALPNAQTWSNGNVFRSLTLLAVTYAEQNGCSLQDALQPHVLASFVTMLEFGEFSGKFDVKIEGLGLRCFVSEIQTTELAVERVAKNIPTVAEVTQGEVINFVQGAFAKLCGAGMNVLVEGREQTLNYIRTPHRFELVLDNPNIIGMRRAAQVMAGSAYAQLRDQPGASEATVRAALEDALKKL